MIQTFDQGTISYWVQVGEVPGFLLEAMEKVVADFLWGGKQHHMRWELLAYPKEEGGWDSKVSGR